jgi:4-diphosphocytidyl-2-C-methyl-D-erythritol kinase
MSLTLKAYAKINLTLEVLARRNDGYHEISSILQTISLADMLYFELSNELELQCSDAVLNTGDNLVLRAAGLLRKVTGYEKGARINLVKEIPVAAGT